MRRTSRCRKESIRPIEQLERRTLLSSTRPLDVSGDADAFVQQLASPVGSVERVRAVRYSVDTLTVEGQVEHRLRANGFHFGTVIADSVGRIIFRPRPDMSDPNGFGTSLFINAFLSGGDPRGGIVSVTATPTGIRVQASGVIDSGGGGTFGRWEYEISIAYDPGVERISGQGTLRVELPASLSSVGRDANLYRLSSNLLVDVFLQGGGRGTTGDLRSVEVTYGPSGDPRDFVWDPLSQPAHFPTDASPFFGVTIEGETNIVDTLRQGDGFQIAIAKKPTIEVNLTSRDPAIAMSFGGVYDLAQAQNFAADNIGVNALVLRGSTARRIMEFDVDLESTPIDPKASDPIGFGGDVLASSRRGKILIRGDRMPNGIIIRSAARNRFRIAPTGGTTLNGSARPLTLSGRAISIFLGIGRDFVRLKDATVAGALRINLGPGADRAAVVDSTLMKRVTIEGHNGNDIVTIRDSIFPPMTLLDGGRGIDRLLADSDFLDELTRSGGRIRGFS